MATGLNPLGLTVVVVTAWFWHLSSASFKGVNYQVQTDGSGNSVCSTDLPTAVLPMEIVGSLSQCATKCNAKSCCMYFQYKADLVQCELYDDMPSNLQTINQCTGYKVLSIPSELVHVAISTGTLETRDRKKWGDFIYT